MMQFTPDEVDINEINTNISKIKGVKNIHHIHIWQINEHDIMFEAHIDMIKDVKITDFETVLKKIKGFLHDNYKIHHVTLQPEFNVEDSKELIKI